METGLDDDVWKRNEIDSPCVKICVLHPSARLCIGCHRTGDEISQWSRMSPEARKTIIGELPARAPLLKGSRRGRRMR